MGSALPNVVRISLAVSGHRISSSLIGGFEFKASKRGRDY
jgi:hypothetical protein